MVVKLLPGFGPVFLRAICNADGAVLLSSTMEQGLRQILAEREVKRIRDENRELSAVLVPVYRRQEQYYILFTKRTEQVKVHKGQISFPGGAYEEGDGTLLGTALRECAEELGITVDSIEILGALDDVVTQTSSYIISPFVAFSPWPYQFKVNTQEIAELLEVPLSALLDENCRHGEAEFINDEVITTYFYHYQDKVIWGATAEILRQLLDIVVQVMEGG
ncbi:NUDIX hydrolase [Chloroflexota bacterium]